MNTPQFPRDYRPSVSPALAKKRGQGQRSAATVLVALLLAATLAMLWRYGATATAAAWLVIGALGGWGIGLVAYWAGHRTALGQLRAELHGVRQHAAALAQLQPHWQWRSDANHRIVVWQPPATAATKSPAPAAPAAPNGAPMPLVWDFFFPGDPQAATALATNLQARRTVQGLRVLPVTPGAWQCDAVPCLDAHGLFIGYLGTAHPGKAVLAEPETVAAPPPPSQTDLEEQAAISYTVSHDLRAPIRVVEGFTRILKEDYGRVLDRIGNDHLDRVLSAAARMNSMIDAMLALARLSTQPLQRQPVNLSQMAEFITEELRRAHPERNIQLQIAPNLSTQGDPTLLRQVLDNLLNNAWKYSARREQAQITFAGELREGRWVYWVQDNGAGFDMRFADRLFGAFQRLHGVNEFAGTGIGLVSARRILRRHGGDIWANAEPEKGARFEFTLGAG